MTGLTIIALSKQTPRNLSLENRIRKRAYLLIGSITENLIFELETDLLNHFPIDFHQIEEVFSSVRSMLLSTFMK